MGVRGITLAEGDRVISMSILRHVEATRGRARRLSQARQRGAARPNGEARGGAPDAEEASGDAIELGEQRYVEMSAAEQFMLTVSENGYGKRTSSYEYRITGRGGKGIVAMAVTERERPAGRLVPGRGRATRSCWSPTAAS